MVSEVRRGPRFFDGVRAPFAGLGFIVSTPAMWPLALVPVVVVLALTALLGWGSVEAMRAFLHAYVPALATDVWYASILRVVLYVIAFVFAAIVAIALAQPLSGPALERIVRAQERALGVREHPPDQAIASMLRSLRVNLVSLFVGGAIIVGLLVVGLVFPPATVVTVPLKFVVSAFILSWDVLDYPLSLRQHGVQQRTAWFRANLSAAAGFGLALAAIFLVPCLGLLLLPAGVAGGARLVAQSERA
jgi:CysZ protein